MGFQKSVAVLVAGIGFSMSCWAVSPGLLSEDLTLETSQGSVSLSTLFKDKGFEQSVHVYKLNADGSMKTTRLKRESPILRPKKPGRNASRAEKMRYAKRLKQYEEKRAEARKVVIWQKYLQTQGGDSLIKARNFERQAITYLDRILGSDNYVLNFHHDLSARALRMSIGFAPQHPRFGEHFSKEMLVDEISEEGLKAHLRGVTACIRAPRDFGDLNSCSPDSVPGAQEESESPSQSRLFSH
jgi:hypothetical protein